MLITAALTVIEEHSSQKYKHYSNLLASYVNNDVKLASFPRSFNKLETSNHLG